MVELILVALLEVTTMYARMSSTGAGRLLMGGSIALGMMFGVMFGVMWVMEVLLITLS